jgi:hypothetical protein
MTAALAALRDATQYVYTDSDCNTRQVAWAIPSWNLGLGMECDLLWAPELAKLVTHQITREQIDLRDWWWQGRINVVFIRTNTRTVHPLSITVASTSASSASPVSSFFDPLAPSLTNTLSTPTISSALLATPPDSSGSVSSSATPARTTSRPLFPTSKQETRPAGSPVKEKHTASVSVRVGPPVHPIIMLDWQNAESFGIPAYVGDCQPKPKPESPLLWLREHYTSCNYNPCVPVNSKPPPPTARRNTSYVVALFKADWVEHVWQDPSGFIKEIPTYLRTDADEVVRVLLGAVTSGCKAEPDLGFRGLEMKLIPFIKDSWQTLREWLYRVAFDPTYVHNLDLSDLSTKLGNAILYIPHKVMHHIHGTQLPYRPVRKYDILPIALWKFQGWSDTSYDRDNGTRRNSFWWVKKAWYCNRSAVMNLLQLVGNEFWDSLHILDAGYAYIFGDLAHYNMRTLLFPWRHSAEELEIIKDIWPWLGVMLQPYEYVVWVHAWMVGFFEASRASVIDTKDSAVALGHATPAAIRAAARRAPELARNAGHSAALYAKKKLHQLLWTIAYFCFRAWVCKQFFFWVFYIKGDGFPQLDHHLSTHFEYRIDATAPSNLIPNLIFELCLAFSLAAPKLVYNIIMNTDEIIQSVFQSALTRIDNTKARCHRAYATTVRVCQFLLAVAVLMHHAWYCILHDWIPGGLYIYQALRCIFLAVRWVLSLYYSPNPVPFMAGLIFWLGPPLYHLFVWWRARYRRNEDDDFTPGEPRTKEEFDEWHRQAALDAIPL